MQAFRQRLRNLPKRTKSIILWMTMLLLISISFLLILSSTLSTSAPPTSPYDTYLSQYIQKYGNDQQSYNRFVFYLLQDKVIFSDKQLKENYYQQINSFAQLTESEFQELYHIVTSVAKSKGYLEIAQFQDNYYYDWSDFMPPVKNMRDFDGSHIFAVTAAMEFQVNKKAVLEYRKENMTLELKDNFITLAEQEVVDCCPSCLEKKTPKSVYYHFKEYGVSIDKKYPYVSSIYSPQPNLCKTERLEKPYFLKDYYEVTSCRELSERLEFGPVVVAVDSRNWRTYEGGIFQGCSTNVKRNHFAVVVGRGIGYWKVRNSWGPRWGEHGHIRLKAGNACGVCGRGSFLEIQ